MLPLFRVVFWKIYATAGRSSCAKYQLCAPLPSLTDWLIEEFWHCYYTFSIMTMIVTNKLLNPVLNISSQVKTFKSSFFLSAWLNGKISSHDYAKRPLQIFSGPSNDWKFTYLGTSIISLLLSIVSLLLWWSIAW